VKSQPVKGQPVSHPLFPPRPIALLAGLLALATGPGCLAYNEECQAFVDNPREVIGHLEEEVYIDKPNARHANNAIAQLAADAFLHSADDTGFPAVFSVINGGNIRAEGVCITRTTLPPGPLKKGVLHEALPFNNSVLALDLTRREIRELMEQSVGELARQGEPILNPPGNFLHLAGGSMEVDCSKPGGQKCELSQSCRVTRLTAGGRDMLFGDPNERFRVALTRFLVTSGFGSSDILEGLDQDASRNPIFASRQGGIDVRLAEQYMRDHYGLDGPGLKVEPDRIKFVNCATPPRPAG